jgi:hypothetical protein
VVVLVAVAVAGAARVPDAADYCILEEEVLAKEDCRNDTKPAVRHLLQPWKHPLIHCQHSPQKCQIHTDVLVVVVPVVVPVVVVLVVVVLVVVVLVVVVLVVVVPVVVVPAVVVVVLVAVAVVVVVVVVAVVVVVVVVGHNELVESIP